MLKFERIKISDTTYEAAGVFDVNGDGILDIVSGEYWYEGPGFTVRHKVGDIQPVDDYFDDFSNYPMDVNGDGFPDIITGGWWGETLRWRENPKGQPVDWAVHDVAKVGPIERACFFDIDGDGEVEVIPNTPGHPLRVFKLARDASGRPAGRFDCFVLSGQPQSHGIGFGDVAGKGRVDIVMANGWYEAPAEGLRGEWRWHPEFDLASASVPVLVHDVDGDGVNDLIVGQSHAYGLAWWKQGRDAAGNRTWTKHDIDPDRSQYHDMQLVDIDNDGELELITGKRYRAHCGHDPGANDPIGLYYFKINGGAFDRVTLDYGPAGQASGVGIYFWVEDLDGNGWKDIVAPGKDGLYLFKNLGPE
ncbi:MAG TPA: VCBS repeat-containing protein [Candidatus Hydrogenedentes bacterium]|nr:VCBS repeat-containing protein [Candidatus Hydrogenedentota bacterium]HPG68547.1 VCBS repeat-containing protein [Candidatus Hydrogenedentota bacterium]